MLIIFEKFFWFIYFKIYTLCFISDYVTKVLLVDLSFLFPSCLSPPPFFLGNFPKLIFQLLCWIFLSSMFHLTFMILFPVTRYHILTSCMPSVPYVSLWEVSVCVLEVGFLLSVLCLCALFLWAPPLFYFVFAPICHVKWFLHISGGW